jgi:hypothetical protein
MLVASQSLLLVSPLGQELLIGGDTLLIRPIVVAEPPYPEVVCSDDLIKSRVDRDVSRPNHRDDLGFLLGATAVSSLKADVYVAANTGVA